MTDSGIRVTTKDEVTGESESAVLPKNGFVCITAGRRYIAHEQWHANGTIVLTLKLDPPEGAEA